MQNVVTVTLCLMLTACQANFETQPPKWTRDNVNVHRSPGTEENAFYSIVDSGVKQMSEGPEQKIQPQPHKELRNKR